MLFSKLCLFLQESAAFLFIEKVKEKKESNAGGLLDAVGRRTRRSNTLKDAVKTLGLGGGLFLN